MARRNQCFELELHKSFRKKYIDQMQLFFDVDIPDDGGSTFASG